MPRLIAEACILFPGWTDKTVLEMNTRRFFALLEHGRDIKTKRKVEFLNSLIDIAAVPLTNHEYVDKLHKIVNLELGTVDIETGKPIKANQPDSENSRVLDLTNPMTGKIIAANFQFLGGMGG